MVTAFGSLPAKGEKSTPDGSSERPYMVVVEFGLTFTSTVPATTVTRTQAAANGTTQHAPSRALGVAPMLVSNVLPEMTLAWWRDGAAQTFPFVATPRAFGSFPVGAWGPPQDPNDRKVPKGEMVEALNALDLSCVATPAAGRTGDSVLPGRDRPAQTTPIRARKPPLRTAYALRHSRSRISSRRRRRWPVRTMRRAHS